jgi:ribonuclease Z
VVILGDTMNSKCIVPWGLGADLLSHEATFSRGMEEKAWVAQHSTAWMAGQCARAMRAYLLVLTHFSARFEGAPRRVWSENGFRGPAMTIEDQLWHEAADEFGSEAVLLAEDLFSVHIPVRQ